MILHSVNSIQTKDLMFLFNNFFLERYYNVVDDLIDLELSMLDSKESQESHYNITQHITHLTNNWQTIKKRETFFLYN